jgi:hypothetical protein
MKLTLATASFLILCTAASAQTAPAPSGNGGHHEMDPACKAAIEKVCPGVKPGGGRIKDCLKEHNTSFKQLCPQDAGKGKHAQSTTPPLSSGPSTAPLATPPAGQ